MLTVLRAVPIVPTTENGKILPRMFSDLLTRAGYSS
jgi:hypothetical protein